MNKKSYIYYALVDPRDLSIRYVGQTVDILHRRHKGDGAYAKRLWVQEIIRAGFHPYKMIIEKAYTENPKDRELELIEYFFSKSELINAYPYATINKFRVQNGYAPLPKGYNKDGRVLADFFSHIINPLHSNSKLNIIQQTSN